MIFPEYDYEMDGNVIGNREFMEQTGSFIAGRIMTAMTNV